MVQEERDGDSRTELASYLGVGAVS
jgi:hypothetical protein